MRIPDSGGHNHFTIYNALPRQFAARRQAVARDFSRPPVVGVVSRLERIKGMDMVGAGVCPVHESYPGVRLVVVGDGSLRGENAAGRAAELRREPRCVEWAGAAAAKTCCPGGMVAWTWC